ncbi:PREDICTED: troponin I 2-like, partial [Rhagoletis zephyria]|uniref:troponin I 2-like n=1 Tax=Rhagoletis zephyria TaxID=28612 RepID=UPI0008119692
ADDAKAKFEEKERKKLEIRQRLEAQMKSTKKKGFMTPERKKRLRQLLRRKAAEEVKRQQEQKEKERQRIINQRTGTPKSTADANEATLIALCKEYHNRIYKLNEDKWDLELTTCLKEYELNDLKERVNDQRGKFIIPPLKKVSKYQTQLEKMRQWTFKLAKMDMRGGLKPVKKEIELDEKLADVQQKFDDRERRRKEVHDRLVQETKKKGFMTPERKKALKQLLRRKAAEEVKRLQEMKDKARREEISRRVGASKNIASLDECALINLCKEYHNRVYKLQEDKWDLELATGTKELEINELKEHVNDQRGKFIVPPLKKVSKYQTQLEKMRQWTYKLAKMDMRGALKPVSKEIKLDEKLPKKENKPEWAASNKQPTTPTTPRT